MVKKVFTAIALIVLAVLAFNFLQDKAKDLSSRSPSEIVEMYCKARIDGDVELLEKIIYFPLGTSETDKHSKLQSIIACPDEKAVLRMVGARRSAKYEKFLDEDTAEVGVVCWSIANVLKRYPVDQIMLKKENGIWKYRYSMHEITQEQLIEAIKKNPKDASAYYLFGVSVEPENPPKAHRYFLKYYELDPNGFWVCDNFMQRLKEFKKEFNETGIYEEEMLAMINNLPDNRIASKAVFYRKLGQLFLELKDYQKAEVYLEKSQDMFKIDPDRASIGELQKTQEELELRKSGKYVDLLDELESGQNK